MATCISIVVDVRSCNTRGYALICPPASDLSLHLSMLKLLISFAQSFARALELGPSRVWWSNHWSDL